jgi:hypothetical protein
VYGESLSIHFHIGEIADDRTVYSILTNRVWRTDGKKATVAQRRQVERAVKAAFDELEPSITGTELMALAQREREAKPNSRRPTFKQAQSEILNYLRDQGWGVKANLKIPHATDIYGDVRLWFKAQAIYIECGKPFRFGSARSLHVDPREVNPPGLIAYAEEYCK